MLQCFLSSCGTGMVGCKEAHTKWMVHSPAINVQLFPGRAFCAVQVYFVLLYCMPSKPQASAANHEKAKLMYNTIAPTHL